MAQHDPHHPRRGQAADPWTFLDEKSLRSIARRRRRGIGVLVVCCLALVPWIGYLATTLPVHYESTQWRLAWVGFDIGLLTALAATAWYSWRGRRLMVPWALTAAVLLVCDAWFDVMLSWGTDDVWWSVAAALLIELPLALVLLLRVRRVLTLLTRHYWHLVNLPGEPPPLGRAPLFPGSPPPGPGAGR